MHYMHYQFRLLPFSGIAFTLWKGWNTELQLHSILSGDIRVQITVVEQALAGCHTWYQGLPN